MDVPKKYWWIAGIAVPIIVAVIGIIPKFISDGGVKGESFHVDVVGTQFNGNVAFNNVTIIAEQARQELGKELPSEMVVVLRKALDLAKAKNFTDAIPAFESVAKVVPVPAILNNVGAAYLATGNKEKAIDSFEKALLMAPKQDTVRFNLGQAKPDKQEQNLSDIPLSGGLEREPNDTILKANPFNVGQTVSAEVASTKDLDYFKFRYTSKLRDKVTITLENQSTTLRPWIKIYDKNKSEILDRHDGTYGANLEFFLSMEPATDYYIQVLPYDSLGKYQLSVIAQQTFDRHEPNDNWYSATRIESGQVMKSNILDVKDTDWYQLGKIDSEEVIVRMENRSTTLRPWIKIYDKNKSEILDRHDGTYGANLEFVFKTQPGSNYFIRVLPYDSHGSYQLSAK